MSNIDGITVLIDGNRLTTFLEASVTLSMLHVCRSFSLKLASDQFGVGFPLPTQAEVEIFIGKDRILTGYVDEVEISDDEEETSAVVYGRDRTCDLVDCVVKTPPIEFSAGTDIFNMIKTWVSPFTKIKVIKSYDGTLKITKKFSVEPSETVMDCIVRVCKQKGIVPVAGTDGSLILTASGEFRSDDRLVRGNNVLKSRSRFSYINRYSQYTFKVQAYQDDVSVALIWGGSTETSATVFDKQVRRYRPFYNITEGVIDAEDCKNRATVEALVRAAENSKASVTVAGFRQSSNKLWTTNLIVPCDLSTVKVNQEMLTSGIKYSQSDAGLVTEIDLVRPDAFNTGTKFKVATKKAIGASLDKKIKEQNNLDFIWN